MINEELGVHSACPLSERVSRMAELMTSTERWKHLLGTFPEAAHAHFEVIGNGWSSHVRCTILIGDDPISYTILGSGEMDQARAYINALNAADASRQIPNENIDTLSLIAAKYDQSDIPGN